MLKVWIQLPHVQTVYPKPSLFYFFYKTSSTFFFSFNASIIIDSSVIKNYIIPIQASLSWPSIVEQTVKFPSTYVGNFTTTEMLISNPSDHPLVVQVVPLLHYPQPEGGLDLLSDRLIVDSFSLDLNGHSMFSLPDLQVGPIFNIILNKYLLALDEF